jgi:hypothetical protein
MCLRARALDTPLLSDQTVRERIFLEQRDRHLRWLGELSDQKVTPAVLDGLIDFEKPISPPLQPTTCAADRIQ